VKRKRRQRQASPWQIVSNA